MSELETAVEKKFTPLTRTREMEPHLFMSRAPVMGYVFRDGSYARFVNHRFITKLRTQIEEMNIVCEEGGNYYVNPEEVIALPPEDPYAALREQIRKEVEAEMRSRTKNTDMGTSEQGKLNVMNSSGIVGASAHSNSSPTPGVAGVDASSKVGAGSVKVASGVTATRL